MREASTTRYGYEIEDDAGNRVTVSLSVDRLSIEMIDPVSDHALDMQLASVKGSLRHLLDRYLSNIDPMRANPWTDEQRMMR